MLITLVRHLSDLPHCQIIHMLWATSHLVLYIKPMAKIQASTSTLSKLNILLLSQLASKVLDYQLISMVKLFLFLKNSHRNKLYATILKMVFALCHKHVQVTPASQITHSYLTLAAHKNLDTTLECHLQHSLLQLKYLEVLNNATCR